MKESGPGQQITTVENLGRNPELEVLKLPTFGFTHEELNGLKGDIKSDKKISWPNESFFIEKNRLDPYIFTAKMDNAYSSQGKSAEIGDDGMTGGMNIEISKGDISCVVDYKLYTQRYDTQIQQAPIEVEIPQKPIPSNFPNIGGDDKNTLFDGSNEKKFDPIKPGIPQGDKNEMESESESEDNTMIEAAGRIDVLQGGCSTQVFEYQGETFTTSIRLGIIGEFEGDFGGEEFQNLIHGAIGSGKLDLEYGENKSRFGMTGEFQFEKYNTGGISLYLNPGWEVYDDKTGKIYLTSKLEKRVDKKLILDITSIVGVRNVSDNSVIKNAMKTGETYGALSTGVTYKTSQNTNVKLSVGKNQYDSRNLGVQLLFTREIF